MGKTVAIAERRGQIDGRTFGNIAERHDKIIRGHSPPGIAAPGKRRNRLGAAFVKRVTGDHRRALARGTRAKARRKRDRQRTQRSAGRESTKPGE